jgi:hypothetical protein
MTGATRPVDGRMLPATRWLAAVILPFLVAASAILYLVPGSTDELFAWTIRPPISAMFLGGTYVGGIWFFTRVLRTTRWGSVRYGFPAVVVFASLMAIATFLHWDRFHFGHISFITWVTLYVTTPVLVLAACIANWRTGRGAPSRREYVIPLPVRLLIAIIGLCALVCGVVLFVFPELAVEAWAWQLTPLTARVLGAILTLPGAVDLWLLADARWSSFRSIFQAQVVSLVFIVGALVIARADLLWNRMATPWFVAGMVLSLLAFVTFYAWCERASASTRERVSAVGE